MSRVAVLLVVLGVAIPYCALGAGLWLSRSTPQHPNVVVVSRVYVCVEDRSHGDLFHSTGGTGIDRGPCPSAISDRIVANP